MKTGVHGEQCSNVGDFSMVNKRSMVTMAVPVIPDTVKRESTKVYS